MTYQEQINEIMDWFDFEKVEQVMDAIDWEWASLCRVPDQGELRRAARSYLREVSGDDKRGWQSGSGGFHAENVDGHLYLSFVVSDWQVEPKPSGV